MQSLDPNAHPTNLPSATVLALRRAVEVLEQVAIKLGQLTYFDCVSEYGPGTAKMYKYKTVLNGRTSLAQSRDRHTAKLDATRGLLLQLAIDGIEVPPPFGIPELFSSTFDKVEYLSQMCPSHRLPQPTYIEIREVDAEEKVIIKIRCQVGKFKTVGVATTKRAAQQRAASRLIQLIIEHKPEANDSAQSPTPNEVIDLCSSDEASDSDDDDMLSVISDDDLNDDDLNDDDENDDDVNDDEVNDDDVNYDVANADVANSDVANADVGNAVVVKVDVVNADVANAEPVDADMVVSSTSGTIEDEE